MVRTHLRDFAARRLTRDLLPRGRTDPPGHGWGIDDHRHGLRRELLGPTNLSGRERYHALLGSQLIFPSIHLKGFQPSGRPMTFSPRWTVSPHRGVAGDLAAGGSWRTSPDSPLIHGLGYFGLVGGGVNFAGSTTTPLPGPRRPPNNFGVGPVAANLIVPSGQADALHAIDRSARGRIRAGGRHGTSHVHAGILRPRAARPIGHPQVPCGHPTTGRSVSVRATSRVAPNVTPQGIPDFPASRVIVAHNVGPTLWQFGLHCKSW